MTFGAFRAASGFSRSLPGFAADGAAEPIGFWAHLLRPERREMVERHLRRVDPTLEGWRLRQAVQESFDSYARYWIESFRLPTTAPRVVEDGFTSRGTSTSSPGCSRSAA